MNEPNPQQGRWRQLIYASLLLVFYVLAYILPLGARELFVPDEPRYAAIPREMIASGDWAVPHFNGIRYFEKPALGYWAHAASLLLFGENNFAVRFPSALAVGLSALLIFLMAKQARWRQEDEQGQFAPYAATLIFLSSIEVFAVGNTAVLDSLFSFFLTACIAAFYAATEATPRSAKEKAWLLVAGVLCGLAFLTKGFLAFAVPVLTLVPYLFWQRRFADILRLSWLPVAAAVLVALPWAVWIHMREPDFWHFFFWNEHIRRFAASDAQHKQSVWFFLLTAPAMVLPWTLLLPAALAGLGKMWRARPEFSNLFKLCLCWLIIPFLFFSLSKGKLLTYILPCFPPFAILMGFGLQHVLRRDGQGSQDGQSKLFQGGVAVNGLLFGLLLVAFAVVQLFDFYGFRPYSQSWQALAVAGGLLFYLLFCFWSYRSKNPRGKIAFFGMALIFLYFIGHYTMPDQTVEVKCPGPILTRNSILPDDVVIADSDSAGAACWYLKRDNIYVLGYPGELDYGFAYPDAAMRLLDLESAKEFIEQHRGKTILVARVEVYKQWRDQLPQPLTYDQNGDEGYAVIRF